MKGIYQVDLIIQKLAYFVNIQTHVLCWMGVIEAILAVTFHTRVL